MNPEPLEESPLDLLIMHEEFRYWDARRNMVPDVELEQIRLKINMMQAGKLNIEGLANITT